MTISNKLQQLQDQYIITVVDLDAWHDQPIYQRNIWLKKQLMAVYKTEYQQNERVVFTLTRGDVYDSDLAGRLIIDLHQLLNTVDISNFFVILLVNDAKFIPEACKWAQQQRYCRAWHCTMGATNERMWPELVVVGQAQQTINFKA